MKLKTNDIIYLTKAEYYKQRNIPTTQESKINIPNNNSKNRIHQTILQIKVGRLKI